MLQGTEGVSASEQSADAEDGQEPADHPAAQGTEAEGTEAEDDDELPDDDSDDMENWDAESELDDGDDLGDEVPDSPAHGPSAGGGLRGGAPDNPRPRSTYSTIVAGSLAHFIKPDLDQPTNRRDAVQGHANADSSKGSVKFSRLMRTRVQNMSYLRRGAYELATLTIITACDNSNFPINQPPNYQVPAWMQPQHIRANNAWGNMLAEVPPSRFFQAALWVLKNLYGSKSLREKFAGRLPAEGLVPQSIQRHRGVFKACVEVLYANWDSFAFAL